MRIILVAYIFPSRLEVSVSAQAGFATVSGLGRCPGRLCHGVSGLGRCQNNAHVTFGSISTAIFKYLLTIHTYETTCSPNIFPYPGGIRVSALKEIILYSIRRHIRKPVTSEPKIKNRERRILAGYRLG